MMRRGVVLILALAGFGCVGEDDTARYRNAVTGEECVPDPGSFNPLHGHNGQGNGQGGHNSPTGIPGDNVDDPHSGRIDCLGDGDSGQGNDERNCTPPGCDAEGCCEEDPEAT